MAIRIQKFADIVGNHVAIAPGQSKAAGDIAAILTNMHPVSEPATESGWTIDLKFGSGVGARQVTIDLPPLLSKRYPTDLPLFLGEGETGSRLIYFRDRLFMPDRVPRSDAEREEVILRVKKAAYEEESELLSLRAAVSNLEAAIEYQKSGRRREPVPDDVKLVVWARDGGACIRCGATENLHFDHIIPVALGGGNTEANIQILCQTCSLKKSNKIAVG